MGATRRVVPSGDGFVHLFQSTPIRRIFVGIRLLKGCPVFRCPRPNASKCTSTFSVALAKTNTVSGDDRRASACFSVFGNVYRVARKSWSRYFLHLED
jgi:hypothetical protein